MIEPSANSVAASLSAIIARARGIIDSALALIRVAEMLLGPPSERPTDPRINVHTFRPRRPKDWEGD